MGLLDSGILSALFRDPVINRLTAGQRPLAGRPLPENLIARVIGLKGDLATLRWEGGQFTASLSARVIPGETLLLQYNGVKKGRSDRSRISTNGGGKSPFAKATPSAKTASVTIGGGIEIA